VEQNDTGPSRDAGKPIRGVCRHLLVPCRYEARSANPLECRQDRNIGMPAEPKNEINPTIGEEPSDMVGNRRLHLLELL
jgi:hypothetical protein